MKKILLIIIFQIVVITFTFSENLTSNVSVFIDGNKVIFNENLASPFVDKNNRTLVPLRTVFEKYGAKVNWNFLKQEATIDYNNHFLEIPIGENYIYEDNIKYKNFAKAIIKNNRTYIPVRKIIELIGGKVNYDSNTKTVIINHNYKVRDEVLIKNKLLYQLQNLNIDDVINSGYKIIIMDYSEDGSENDAYSKDEIQRLKNSKITPLAYISIGEAEKYRYYWNDTFKKENFIGIENRDWQGNYKVRYWDSEWKNIVFTYLDKLIDSGFDGAYLDIVDAYEYWSDDENKEKNLFSDPKSEKQSAKLMIQFIKEINQYCKSKNPNFLVIPQNGSNIIDYDDGTYISNIDGIGIEDLWFMETERREDNDVYKRLQNLQTIKNAGKFVLVTDYIYDDFDTKENNTKRASIFINEANQNGFKYYISNRNRNLDEILKIK